MSDPNLSELNAAIAGNYDAFPYDADVNSLIDVSRACGLAALFGPVGYPADVLDLGCGTGAQLAHVASQVTGRIVGTDISPQACRIAEDRLAPFGERARILCGDLLEIAPEDLGEFDVIYNIGVIYVTPPEVRRRILELIGRCLRPHGIAIMSYYAGSIPALRANLHQTLRAACTGLDPDSAVAHARNQLAELAISLEESKDVEMLRQAISDTARQSDVFFFHEVLNGTFEPMRTSVIERTLSQHGASFVSYLPPVLDGGEVHSSIRRAVEADVSDFGWGQYRYAVFAKYGAPTLDGIASPPVAWECTLSRANFGDFDGEQAFYMHGTDVKVVTRNAAVMAMFDCLMDGPLGWSDIADRVSRSLAKAGLELDAQSLKTMENDLRHLWRHALVFPLLLPPSTV